MIVPKDQKVRAFIKFFNSQGAKFIDIKSGEEIKVEEEDEPKN